MQRQSDAYTLFFALLVCVACSFTVALSAEGLRGFQDKNVQLDKKKNILKALQVQAPGKSWKNVSNDQLEALFEDNVRVVVVDDRGEFVNGKNPDSIKPDEALFPLYLYQDQGTVLAYCLPIEGKGLWSTLRGYLAVEADARRIRGITFYDHKETPGLGAEIEKEWFQNNFKGKAIFDPEKQELRPPQLIKADKKAKIKKSDERYYVDSITGATMTSQGVSDLLAEGLRRYEPFMRKVRKIE